MIQALQSLTVMELAGRIALVIAAISIVVQITPIKVNPWTWLARKIGKAINGDMMDEFKAMREDLDAMKAEMEETNAKNLRTKIIRFASEIRVHQLHTKDYFDEVMDDITAYERYCDTHKNFKNNITVMSSELITKTYKKCLEENSFL